MRNKIFAFILAGICLVGCSLEEKPYGFYSEGNYYKTEADAQSATMYIYDAINYIETGEYPADYYEQPEPRHYDRPEGESHGEIDNAIDKWFDELDK